MEPLTQKRFHPFLQSGGEMGELTRNYDWSQTSVGSPDTWPQSLRTIVSILLRSKFPMFLWWGDDLTQFYNDAYRPSLGNEGKHPQALGQKGVECWPEIWEIIYPLIRQVKTTGEATWSEDQLVPIYRNGKIEDVWWTFGYSPVYDDWDKPAGVLVTCMETTKKVQTFNKLQLSEKRFQNLVRDATVGIIVLMGEEMRVEIVNEAYGNLLNREYRDLIGKPLFEVIPEAKPYFHHILEGVRTTGEPVYLYDHPFFIFTEGIKKEGFLNLIYAPYKEEDGKITGIMALCHDVTEQVLARKKAEESESRFRLLADAMPQFVWTADKEGNLNYFNQAVYDYSGLTKEQIAEEGWLQIVHPDEREENTKHWMHSVETGKDFIFHHQFRNKDGVYRWQLSRAVPQKDKEGNIQMWIGTSTDIHEHKLFEEDLQARVLEKTKELIEANERLVRSNQELKRSNINLEEFAYAASHDMKEPIRKIHFFADRVKTNLQLRFNDEEIRYFERMEAAAKRMGSLIDDLLSYSQVSLRPRVFEDVELNDVVKQVLTDLELEIEEKRAQIKITQLPTIRGHRRQIQQAFQNLISNALKFHNTDVIPFINITSEKISGIDARLPLSEKENQQQFYLIQISDNGIGFEQSDAERIFNVFTRLHGNAEYKGTGVGLSIVRKVAENHNGFVYAKSGINEGATFQLLIPVENEQVDQSLL